MHRTTQWYPIKLKTQSALISPLWGNTGLTSCSQSADGDWHHCIKLLQHYFIFTHSVKCWAGANVSVAELKQSTKLLQGPSVWTRKFLWWSMKVLLPAQKGNGLTCFITWKKKKKIFWFWRSVFGYSWWEMYTSDSDKTYPDQHGAMAVPSWGSSYNFEHSHLSLVI